jgi:hypothetical protein
MGTDSDPWCRIKMCQKIVGEMGGGMPGVVTWGVIGGGDSARRFAAGLNYLTGAKLTSIWTRKPEVDRSSQTH